MNTRSQNQKEGEEARTWECELPIRLASWKRTASGKKRTNTREYRNQKKLLRDYFGLKRCPRWGSAWVELEAHVFFATYASHGDWDNLGKILSDALEGILYDNDRQVVSGKVVKHLSSGEERVVLLARVVDLDELEVPGSASWVKRSGIPELPAHLQSTFALFGELRPSGERIEMCTNHIEGDVVVMHLGGADGLSLGFYGDGDIEGVAGGNLMPFDSYQAAREEARRFIKRKEGCDV